MDTVETGWTFLQGIGAPEGISLAGPVPVPQDWDFGEYLTEALETLREGRVAGQGTEKNTVVGCSQKPGHDCARSHKSGSFSFASRLQHGAPDTAIKKVDGLENVGSG